MGSSMILQTFFGQIKLMHLKHVQFSCMVLCGTFNLNQRARLHARQQCECWTCGNICFKATDVYILQMFQVLLIVLQIVRLGEPLRCLCGSFFRSLVWNGKGGCFVVGVCGLWIDRSKTGTLIKPAVMVRLLVPAPFLRRSYSYY